MESTLEINYFQQIYNIHKKNHNISTKIIILIVQNI